MINFLFIWLVCMAFIMPIYSVNMGDPFGLLNEIQTECEYQSLTIGSRLSDAFNSYDESVPFYRRFNHENHEKMNSFHRMIMLEMERRHLPHFQKDNNLKREDKIHKYHHHGHAVHNNSAGHAFHSIVNKAVSFLGDYTLFPVFTSLLVPLHAHSPSNELDRMLIDLCPASTEFIQSAVSSNLSDSDAAKFSCNGYGHDGSFSFHQSNQLLEKNLFQEVQSLFSSSSGTKKPDILIIQLGHQACHLPYLEESKNTEYDKSYTSKAETNIKTFFTSLKEIIDKSKSTTVIISLPSRSLLGNSDSDYCTWRLNRIIAYEAHVKGFIVLEKEEIETRLLFRTERAIDPVKTMKSLVSFPGSQIIAASLIHLLNCLEQKLVFTL